MVFNPHPSGARIACAGVEAFNRAIADELGIENVATIIKNPTIESADAIFNHRDARVLVVTGGPAVARAALQARKKAIVAGPGNPPSSSTKRPISSTPPSRSCREPPTTTTCSASARRRSSLSNSIFNPLMDAMSRHGGYRLNTQQIEALTRLTFSPPKEPGGHAVLNRDVIGKDATVLAKLIGACRRTRSCSTARPTRRIRSCPKSR